MPARSAASFFATSTCCVARFVPSPCAHPLCYQVAYLLMDPEGGAPVPFTRFDGGERYVARLEKVAAMERGMKHD